MDAALERKDGEKERLAEQKDILKDDTSGDSISTATDERKNSDAHPVDEDLEEWEPLPPKILMEDKNAVPLEMRSQIQMYATTE